MTNVNIYDERNKLNMVKGASKDEMSISRAKVRHVRKMGIYTCLIASILLKRKELFQYFKTLCLYEFEV